SLEVDRLRRTNVHFFFVDERQLVMISIDLQVHTSHDAGCDDLPGERPLAQLLRDEKASRFCDFRLVRSGNLLDEGLGVGFEKVKFHGSSFYAPSVRTVMSV